MQIRFHLDENVHSRIAEALRRRGIEVTTSFDAGLMSATDEQHLVFAREQGRVVVTHDVDFLRLHARGIDHAGIVYCHVQQRSLAEMIRALSALALSTEPVAMVNKVEYL